MCAPQEVALMENALNLVAEQKVYRKIPEVDV